MDHALAVHLGERRADCRTYGASARAAARPRGDERLERQAVEILHRVVEKPSLRVAEVVDLDRIRMRERAREPDLALEARASSSVARWRFRILTAVGRLSSAWRAR